MTDVWENQVYDISSVSPAMYQPVNEEQKIPLNLSYNMGTFQGWI